MAELKLHFHFHFITSFGASSTRHWRYAVYGRYGPFILNNTITLSHKITQLISDSAQNRCQIIDISTRAALKRFIENVRHRCVLCSVQRWCGHKFKLPCHFIQWRFGWNWAIIKLILLFCTQVNCEGRSNNNGYTVFCYPSHSSRFNANTKLKHFAARFVQQVDFEFVEISYTVGRHWLIHTHMGARVRLLQWYSTKCINTPATCSTISMTSEAASSSMATELLRAQYELGTIMLARRARII